MEPGPPTPQTPNPPPGGPWATQPAPSDTPAKIVYILYILSLAFGVTALVAVVVAYVYRGDAPEPLASHYRFQIRTFWIGLVYACAGVVLLLVLVGWVVIVAEAVWVIVRCVKGLRYLDRREPVPNVETWLW